jgi:hypothetical protein
MSFDPEKIPVWLRRTSEQQAQDVAYQKRLRQAQGPGRRPSRTEAHLLRAEAVRRSAEAQLEHLRRQPDPAPEHVATAAAQLAEALAAQGHFSDAATLHPQSEQAKRYQAIASAIERDDTEPPCPCPADNRTDEASGRPILLPTENITEMVFSLRHNRLMPVVQCLHCGDMNVKPAPAHLEERARRVHEEHQKAKGGHSNGS